MLIKFNDPDTLMSIEIDTDRQRKMAHQEFAERRPDEQSPGGYGPSKAFNAARDDFMAKRKKHTEYLKRQISSGQGITPNDVQAAKTLEIIEVESRFDHKGNHCRDLVRSVEKGSSSVSGENHATWKSMEIMASNQKQMGQMAHRDRVTVSASHGPLNGTRR